MRYRTATLMPRTSIGTAGTWIQNIYLKDPITALIVTSEITTTAIPRLMHDAGAITNFEIIDGSDVLFSLCGREAHGLQYFEGDETLGGAANNITAGTHLISFKIPFGRHKYDPLLALDPKKFQNPQIRITHNALGVEASASHHYITIIAETFDEFQPSPIGFLQTREWHRYLTAATSTYTYVDIPTDLPLRKLIMRPEHRGTVPTVIMAEARLSEENDKVIPFDIAVGTLLDINNQDFGMCFEAAYGTGHGAGRPAFSAICGGLFFAYGNLSGTGGFQLQVYSGGELGVLGAVAGDYWTAECKGTAPHNMLAYPFGNQQDIEDWYDVTKIGSLRLRYLTGAACPVLGHIHTILQQLRRY